MSARQIVRQNIAKLIAGTSDLYARVLGGVEEEAEMDREGNDGVLDQKDIAAKVQKIREPFLKLIVRSCCSSGLGGVEGEVKLTYRAGCKVSRCRWPLLRECSGMMCDQR